MQQRPTPSPSPSHVSPRLGLSYVFIATFGLSLKGIWARLAYGEGFEVTDVLFYRAAFSLPLIAAMTWMLRWQRVRDSRLAKPKAAAAASITRSRDKEESDTNDPARSVKEPASTSQPVSRKNFTLSVLLGALFSLGMLADFEAIRHVGAGISRVILFGFPVVVMLLDAALLRKSPPQGAWLGFCVAWLGLCAVALLGEGTVSGLPRTMGLAWAFASLLIYGAFVWCSGRLARDIGAARLTLISNVSTCLCVIVAVAIFSEGSIPSASHQALGWVLLMVAVSTVVPYYLMNEGIVRLGTARASLLAMLGPVVTLTAGWFVLKEPINTLQLVGVIGVLGGVWLTRQQLPPRVSARNAAHRTK